MWNKPAGGTAEDRLRRPFYRPGFLLVRLRWAGRGWFFIPLSLAVLEETVAGLADLARLVEYLIALGRRKDPPARNPYRPGAIGGILRRCAEAVGTIRTGRPYRLVEVETDKVGIKLDVI